MRPPCTPHRPLSKQECPDASLCDPHQQQDESVTIAQFPDMAAAKAWYDSPEYQDAKQHRLSGADFRIILTEGL